MAQLLVVDGAHLKRLMRLCRMLCSGNGITIKQLQVKLRMSRRTIFRDLNSLEQAGIGLELGDDGYRIRETLAQCRKLLAQKQLDAMNKLLDVCLK